MAPDPGDFAKIGLPLRRQIAYLTAMQTIGERLEEARKRRGISIREASEATKIRSEYLHKFESNSLDINLPEVYIRGFLRNYANYLKLNGDKLIADYKTLAPGDGRSSKRENREVYGRVDLSSSARQPATEPAPDTDASDAVAVAPASTKVRSNIFPASAANSTAPIDPALLIKGGDLFHGLENGPGIIIYRRVHHLALIGDGGHSFGDTLFLEDLYHALGPFRVLS